MATAYASHRETTRENVHPVEDKTVGVEKRRRILLVTPNLHRPFGGPPVTILKMVRAIINAGHSVEVVFAGAKESESDSEVLELSSRGARFHRFEPVVPRRAALRWGLANGLIQAVWRMAADFDIVTVHQIWGFQGILLLKRAVRERAVHIPHESLTQFDISKPTKPVITAIKYLQIALMRCVKMQLLFASRLEEATSIQYGRASTRAIAYHPLGFDDAELMPLGDFKSHRRIGYIGRLHEKKNVDSIIAAIKNVPGVELFIAGSGGLEPSLRALADELGVSHRITWCGFLTSDEKEGFYQSVDAIIVPSTYECFGQAAAEPMLRGVPLICTDQVGAAEGLRDGLECIRCGIDAESIATAIGKLVGLSEADRRAMAVSAREYALTNFADRAFVSTLLSLVSANEAR